MKALIVIYDGTSLSDDTIAKLALWLNQETGCSTPHVVTLGDREVTEMMVQTAVNMPKVPVENFVVALRPFVERCTTNTQRKKAIVQAIVQNRILADPKIINIIKKSDGDTMSILVKYKMTYLPQMLAEIEPTLNIIL